MNALKSYIIELIEECDDAKLLYFIRALMLEE